MKINWLKRLFVIIILLNSIFSVAQGSDCELRWDRFSKDVNGTTEASRALIDAIDENSDIIMCWSIMDEVGERALTTKIDELRYLSEYLKSSKKTEEVVVKEIKNAGGYVKWKVGISGQNNNFADYLTINGRVNNAGNKSSMFNSFSDENNINIPKRYLNDENRFNNLATDPDQGNTIKASTRKEAMTGIEAEIQNIVNEIEREPKGIEFYDSNRTTR